jgi:NADH:ubiquinone oxidoreductase subunit E
MIKILSVDEVAKAVNEAPNSEKEALLEKLLDQIDQEERIYVEPDLWEMIASDIAVIEPR